MYQKRRQILQDGETFSPLELLNILINSWTKAGFSHLLRTTFYPEGFNISSVKDIMVIEFCNNVVIYLFILSSLFEMVSNATAKWSKDIGYEQDLFFKYKPPWHLQGVPCSRALWEWRILMGSPQTEIALLESVKLKVLASSPWLKSLNCLPLLQLLQHSLGNWLHLLKRTLPLIISKIVKHHNNGICTCRNNNVAVGQFSGSSYCCID